MAPLSSVGLYRSFCGRKAVVARALSPATTHNAPVALDSGLAKNACTNGELESEHDEGQTFHEEDV